jgi:NADH-quinone oxidoreductase subunit E
MTDRVLSDAFYAKADEITARYPVSRSALIMLLHEAQDEIGFVSDDVIVEIGTYLGLSSADVAGVVTFYTMFKRKSPGKYLISLCTEPGCGMFGADDTIIKLREIVGPENTTTEDGVMSWEQVECLAFCGAAPAAQVNYCDVPHLTSDRAETLCAKLRAGGELSSVLEEMRAGAKLPVMDGSGNGSAPAADQEPADA